MDVDGSARRRRVRLASGRACVHCKRRKTRCTGGDNGRRSCAYCSQAGKTCSFEKRPDRTPLTRNNLDESERLCSQLRSLLHKLNPDLDVEAAIATLPRQPNTLPDDSPQSSLGTEEHAAQEVYEWHETSPSPVDEAISHSTGQDGMAILSTPDAGYLGRSSASDILQEIASLLPSSTSIKPRGDSQRRRATLDSRTANASFDPPDLASSAVLSRLIDAYFLFYNSSYPIIHEKSFRTEATERDRMPSRSTWRIVYYMVLAIGYWVSTPSTHTQCPYYAAARSRVTMEILEAGTMETVQGLLLMGNYLQKRDRPNTGYNLIGIAHRMALGIGLHREKPGTDDRMLYERQRQLFWVVYCFDSGFSITTGRPMTVAEGFIDTNLPRNIEDRDCTPGSSVPAPVNYPTIYSALIAQAQLARIANGIYHEFLSAKTANKKIEYQMADVMANRLDAWRTHLPPYFASTDAPAWFHGPRSVVLWKEQNLRILLWRGTKKFHPYLPSKIDAESRCLDAALESIHCISNFCASSEDVLHFGISWYATYFLSQATLVLEASHLSQCSSAEARDHDPTHWQVSIAAARECLELLAKKNNSARRCLDILSRIHSPDASREATVPTSQEDQGGAAPLRVLDCSRAFDPSQPGFQLDEFVTDPILRMMMDQASFDTGNAPLDLFNNPSINTFGNASLDHLFDAA